MFHHRYSLLAAVLCLGPLFATAQKAAITVNNARILGPVPEKLYGACIEDVNHEIYGGLYDQRLYGESFEEPAAGASFKGWNVFGGQWKTEDGGVKIDAGPGYKLVSEGDHTSISAQLRFGPSQVNAGLITNVQHARTGADNFFGYEISLDPNRHLLVLGKHRNNWQLLKEIPVSFDAAGWNTLRVVTDKGRLQVWLNDKAVADYTDVQDPLPTGRVGLRTYNAQASFRDVQLPSGVVTFTGVDAPLISAVWQAVNTTQAGRFELDNNKAFTGKQSQVLVHDGSKGIIGMANKGLNGWGIAVRAGQEFESSISLKGADFNGTVTVALQSADGSKTYATKVLGHIDNNWGRFTFRLRANTTDPNARFVIYTETAGKLWIDQAMLTSTGDDQFKGLPLRADIAKKMQEQGLNFLRYGGTMVNAPEYRFKKMIGPREQRPPYKGHWYPYSSNGFGIEEFLQFCEAAGFEAAFAINIEETPQDAADMVEYLRGDTSTQWGRQRAVNGHPAPYKVKYFEIGNEEVLFNGDVSAEYDHYIERFLLLHTAMRAKDTSIKFINAAWWRPSSPNTEKVFKALNGKADYWDLHTDADDPRSGRKVDSTLTRMQQLFNEWAPNTNMKCAIFEENGGRHDLARALGHATTLNAVRRHGDFVLTSCAANALQPYGQNDNGWDQGQVFFTPSQVWGMPPFYAQQMAAAHHQPLYVSCYATRGLDITATRSEDGKQLVLHVINPDAEAKFTQIQIEGFPNAKKQIKTLTLSGAPDAVNTPEQPIRIAPRNGVLADYTAGYTFPAWSYTILRFER